MTEEQNQAFFTSLEDLKKNLEGGLAEDSRVLDLSTRPDFLSPEQEQWFSEDYEGQLSVDIYQTKDNIVVKSTIAGVRPEDLEIYIHNDLLTIRGKREQEKEEKEADYFYKECYWGGFSRSIILPVEVQADRVEATFKNGILKITLPKAQKSKLINVEVKED
ncbi:MAG TPA: Hsp20/alpha crystallin family protein [Candidatus Uhrbacteria bacterium]|nr:Hsp20/alpha crystallin family protein [Candidatus Uhrbacteria bacterium]